MKPSSLIAVCFVTGSVNACQASECARVEWDGNNRYKEATSTSLNGPGVFWKD